MWEGLVWKECIVGIEGTEKGGEYVGYQCIWFVVTVIIKNEKNELCHFGSAKREGTQKRADVTRVLTSPLILSFTLLV